MTANYSRSLAGAPALLLTLFTSSSVFATTAGVPGPSVKSDDRSYQYRASYRPSEDGGPHSFTHRMHYQHSLDDSRRLRFILQQSKTEGKEWELRYSRVEYMWQYNEGTETGRASGLRFDLQLVEGDDEPHFARVGWITQFDWLGARTRLNAFVGRDFGEDADSGLSLATRAEMTWATGKARIGFQMFNGYNTTSDMGDFEEQRHQIGPVISGKAGEWSLFGSYLFGVSDRAPDGAVRFNIGRSL